MNIPASVPQDWADNAVYWGNLEKAPPRVPTPLAVEITPKPIPLRIFLWIFCVAACLGVLWGGFDFVLSYFKG